VQLNYDDMMEQKETENAEGKRHFADFCLWKAFKEGVDRNDVAWESDLLKKGRPGWHLECSAMAQHYFGKNTMDFHGGGIDLKFPHHENEIAQAEGVMAPGTSFCQCWFHNGFVNLAGEKMSKSLGNFVTLRDACPSSDDVRAYRYLVVSSQYRNPLTFSDAVLKAAKKAVKRMDRVQKSLQEVLSEEHEDDANSDDSELASKIVPAALQNFEAAIVDDLSMPRAAAALFSLVKAAEQEFKRSNDFDVTGLRAVSDALQNMDRVFGIFYQVPVRDDDVADEGDEETEVPAQVMELVAQRTEAKEAKDWELADSLRARIAELGFAVKDVKDGEPIVSPVE
jgi:cysteinyl-tRNA synthetase